MVLPSTYRLTIAGIERELPVVAVAPGLAIASFVILGDAELVEKTAPELVRRLPSVQYLVSAEAKGIPLA
ncbi:MAG: adenine phosphoribosyltransferase, partial [Firmicutes bacterium]|nr:adenine phosphoribosyltransferase [Bacillota bacterium]